MNLRIFFSIFCHSRLWRHLKPTAIAIQNMGHYLYNFATLGRMQIKQDLFIARRKSAKTPKLNCTLLIIYTGILKKLTQTTDCTNGTIQSKLFSWKYIKAVTLFIQESSKWWWRVLWQWCFWSQNRWFVSRKSIAKRNWIFMRIKHWRLFGQLWKPSSWKWWSYFSVSLNNRSRKRW